MHAYVFWRVSSLPVFARRILRFILAGAYLFLWASYFLARVINHAGGRVAAQTFETIGGDWIGVLFLLFVALLAVDVITLFGMLLPSVAHTMRKWALGERTPNEIACEFAASREFTSSKTAEDSLSG